VSHPLARRGLLKLAMGAPLLVWAAVSQADPACVDMSALSDSEKSLRTSLNYRLVSDDPKRVCGGCSFFAAGKGDCGGCSILNGPTTDQSRCDAWAAN
jgi:hypothetical protein